MEKLKQIFAKVWEFFQKVLPLLVMEYIRWLQNKIRRGENEAIDSKYKNEVLKNDLDAQKELNSRPAIDIVREAASSKPSDKP